MIEEGLHILEVISGGTDRAKMELTIAKVPQLISQSVDYFCMF